MNYNWPKTKFADENTFLQQMEHILSEAQELVMAVASMDEDAAHEELADLHHAIETYWRKAEAERGEDLPPRAAVEPWEAGGVPGAPDVRGFWY